MNIISIIYGLTTYVFQYKAIDSHFTLTVPLSTQVYKLVAENFMPEVTMWWTNIPSRGEKKYS